MAALVLLDLAGPGQEGVEVAIFVDQGRGRLDTDAGRARDVVHGIAAQGLDVDDLLRRHPELLDYLGPADTQVLHGVEHRHPLADQLHQVLVGGDDHHFAAKVAGAAAVGGDDVVGLVSGQLQAGDTESLGRLAHQGELRNQVLGRGRPVSLVLIVQLVAKRLFGVVEHHRQMGRRIGRRLHIKQQLPQHVAETLHRADRQAIGLACQGR